MVSLDSKLAFLFQAYKEANKNQDMTSNTQSLSPPELDTVGQ